MNKCDYRLFRSSVIYFSVIDFYFFEAFCELINNLLSWLFKVALLPLRVRQPNLASVILAQVVEEVLVETRVLCVIGRHLKMDGIYY